jgi:feruloyl esterase
MKLRSLSHAWILLLPCWSAPAAAGDCAALKSLALPDTTITLVESVSAGDFTPPTAVSVGPPPEPPRDGAAPPPPAAPKPLENLPAFCRVAGTVPPAIEFEVWMPAAGWNGRLHGVGLGGYLGAVNYMDLAGALRKGYATASTDAGHKSAGNDTRWGIGNAQAIVDLGHRAHHEMTVRAKSIIEEFYGEGPRYSYFTGCSSGGWQALTEAQRYPDDYDGVVAGGPALNVVHLHAGSIWNVFQTRAIRPESFALLHERVTSACDMDDGVADGLVQNPQACAFDVASVQCTGADTSKCLTEGEVRAFRNVYAGARNSSGEPVYPGWPLTSEGGFAFWTNPVALTFVSGTFRDLTYQGDKNWDVEKFDFDLDVQKADAAVGVHLNSNDPDLRSFAKSKGRIILYHGWDDALVPATATIDYYERAAAASGGMAQTREFARLFVGPGVGHCAALPGPGPHSFDALAALENWVENGVAPDRIIASNPKTGMKRPLCPYPQVARYGGKGDDNDPANFACVSPK